MRRISPMIFSVAAKEQPWHSSKSVNHRLGGSHLTVEAYGVLWPGEQADFAHRSNVPELNYSPRHLTQLNIIRVCILYTNSYPRNNASMALVMGCRRRSWLSERRQARFASPTALSRNAQLMQLSDLLSQGQ